MLKVLTEVPEMTPLDQECLILNEDNGRNTRPTSERGIKPQERYFLISFFRGIGFKFRAL
jgi:hypothetical protein